MRLSGGPNWTLGVARRGLARVLMSIRRLYDHVHQRPLRIDVTLYRLARQFAQLEKRQRLQEIERLAGSFHVGVHLLSGHVDQSLLNFDERLGCLPRNLGQLGLL